MGTYTQWRTAFDRQGVKRVTWVCGTQRVLVEEVVEATRWAVAPSDLDYVTFTAGQDRDRDIWASANQYPLSPTASRLVVVRDAEKVRSWAPLGAWLANSRHLPTVHLVFVSNDEKLRYGEKGEGDVNRPLLPPAAWLKTRGYLVECGMPNEADAIRWAQRQADVLPGDVAAHLLTRVGGDLRAALTVCRQLRVFDGVPSTRVVDVLCGSRPQDAFAESLLWLRKPSALQAAETVPDKEMGGLVGLLDSRLDVMTALHRAVKSRASARDLAQVPGVPAFLARQYAGVAGEYDPARVAHRRKVLVLVDEALGLGARQEALEGLVALW